jgi:hypothetical protein
MKKYITWNNFDINSIKLAEQKKIQFENLGFKLIHTTSNCLTYLDNSKDCVFASNQKKSKSTGVAMFLNQF